MRLPVIEKVESKKIEKVESWTFTLVKLCVFVTSLPVFSLFLLAVCIITNSSMSHLLHLF